MRPLVHASSQAISLFTDKETPSRESGRLFPGSSDLGPAQQQFLSRNLHRCTNLYALGQPLSGLLGTEQLPSAPKGSTCPSPTTAGAPSASSSCPQGAAHSERAHSQPRNEARRQFSASFPSLTFPVCGMGMAKALRLLWCGEGWAIVLLLL